MYFPYDLEKQEFLEEVSFMTRAQLTIFLQFYIAIH